MRLPFWPRQRRRREEPAAVRTAPFAPASPNGATPPPPRAPNAARALAAPPPCDEKQAKELGRQDGKNLALHNALKNDENSYPEFITIVFSWYEQEEARLLLLREQVQLQVQKQATASRNKLVSIHGSAEKTRQKARVLYQRYQETRQALHELSPWNPPAALESGPVPQQAPLTELPQISTPEEIAADRRKRELRRTLQGYEQQIWVLADEDEHLRQEAETHKTNLDNAEADWRQAHRDHFRLAEQVRAQAKRLISEYRRGFRSTNLRAWELSFEHWPEEPPLSREWQSDDIFVEMDDHTDLYLRVVRPDDDGGPAALPSLPSK
jgi:hypothetical protein